MLLGLLSKKFASNYSRPPLKTLWIPTDLVSWFAFFTMWLMWGRPTATGLSFFDEVFFLLFGCSLELVCYDLERERFCYQRSRNFRLPKVRGRVLKRLDFLACKKPNQWLLWTNLCERPNLPCSEIFVGEKNWKLFSERIIVAFKMAHLRWGSREREGA